MKRLSVLAVSLAALGAFAGCNRTRGFTIRQVMEKFHGPSGKQLAADMFDSSDADVRRRAVERIAARKSLRREPYLGACAIMVKDPDPTVRSAAIRALAAAGDATYIPNVAAALSSDTDPICRRDAAAALDLLVGDEAVDPLITAAGKDDDVGVRSASAYALRHYTPCVTTRAKKFSTPSWPVSTTPSSPSASAPARPSASSPASTPAPTSSPGARPLPKRTTPSPSPRPSAAPGGTCWASSRSGRGALFARARRARDL